MKRYISLVMLNLLFIAGPLTAQISIFDETVKFAKQLAPEQETEIEQVAVNLRGIDKQFSAVLKTVKSFANLTDQLINQLNSFVPQVAEQLKKVNNTSLTKQERLQAMVAFINLLQGQIQFMLGFLGNYINATADLYPGKSQEIKDVISEIQVVLRNLQGVIKFLRSL